jgi:hypothetical protein
MEMPFRPNAVAWCSEAAQLKGGRGIVKHLHLAIFCVARAKCGVLETDCSCTAPFSFSNSELTMFEFSQTDPGETRQQTQLCVDRLVFVGYPSVSVDRSIREIVQAF